MRSDRSDQQELDTGAEPCPESNRAPDTPPGEAATRYQPRTYDQSRACVFRSTRAKFGGLSNMAAGYPLSIGTVTVRTAEALYQACRYPHLPDVQAAILAEASPMSAKMVSKKHYPEARPDWERVKVRVMRWCLEVKLAQHFAKFGRLLELTGEGDIVEESGRDRFWGAVRTTSEHLSGVNALGRLLMELRSRYRSDERYGLLHVKRPKLRDALLLSQPLAVVDERAAFIAALLVQWRHDPPPGLQRILFRDPPSE